MNPLFQQAQFVMQAIIEHDEMEGLDSCYTMDELLSEMRRSMATRRFDFDTLDLQDQDALVAETKEDLEEAYGWECLRTEDE